MNSAKLKKPNYKIISEVAMKFPGNSLALISLGKSSTIKSISKDDIVATGSMGGVTVDFKSLYDLESGVSDIYVLISGINHSGQISLTISSDLVSSTINIEEEDCYKIYSLYYGENFEQIENINDFCTTNNIVAEIKNSETYGKYVQSSSDSNKSGYLCSIANLNCPDNGNYILEFEAQIANVASDKMTSTFLILTDSSDKDSYLLKLASSTHNWGSTNMTWFINDSDTSITLPQEFFHFKMIIDRNTNQIALYIYSLKDEVILEKHLLEKGPNATSDIVKHFYMSLPRYTRGIIRLNNISIYSYENLEINTPFNEKTQIISLNSYLESINNIPNKSIYCEISYDFTNVTIKSIRAGKTYVYLDGILNINLSTNLNNINDKALALLIINIDERGFISCEEIYIFATDPNFNKIPSTIQKDFHTYTTLGDLDINEPDDNPNITPFVDVDELNSKFEHFESEKLVKPRAKVGFCISNNKWNILYTSDEEINEYSEYILSENAYVGFLDCVNASFSFLSSNRKNRAVKEKISIITSGSTGTAAQNTKSIVNSNYRMNNSVAINLKEYLILDFENNYIYSDNSEDYVNSSKTYKIACFIDGERGINNCTICNLNLMGNNTYGVFIAQGNNILFQNINIMIAQGENRSSGIGIRAQSQANAIANVELGRWSHDLYFDNCTFNGIGEHGIETFNVYNIYANTIKITDVGGCGVLLNCSFDVWINRIIGIRCCASDTYAALRLANDAGPNINIHYVYGEATGNGIFLVSSSNDIKIDKINLVNVCSTPIYIGGSAGLQIQSGKIISNGGEVQFSKFNGEIGKKNATTSNAIFIVGGSSSQFLPQWNNVFENIKIDGFKSGYSERYKMSSNYNIYNNIDTSGCQQIREISASGTGTEEDVAFGFCVTDGMKGPGNEIITGEKIISGDYIYALNKDSSGYILMEYSGLDSHITIPKRFQGKPISRIGSFAFFGNRNIISVTINNNISSLGGLSFGNCLSLKYLNFVSGGTYEIGHCAFRGCKNLSNVDLTGVKILRASCFAWCKSLKNLVCPKSVTYFGANCFYNDNINLTIECDDISSMTVEPYAFYFIGFDSKIDFTGVSEPTNPIGVSANATSSVNYYYNSHSYVERNVYKEGVWCKYYYHVKVKPQFKE